MEHWKHSERYYVHKVLQAAHIPLSHRAHLFLSKEYVLYIQNLAWLRATALELIDLGITSTSQSKKAWLSLRVRYKMGALLLTLGSILFQLTVRVTPSWRTLLNTSLTWKSKGSVQNFWPPSQHNHSQSSSCSLSFLTHLLMKEAVEKCWWSFLKSSYQCQSTFEGWERASRLKGLVHVNEQTIDVVSGIWC